MDAVVVVVDWRVVTGEWRSPGLESEKAGFFQGAFF
jgi:hypothetical protein